MPSAGRRPAPTSVNYVPIDLRGAVLALVASLFWGANPVVLKIGLLDAPPLRLACLRFLVGTVTIVIWAWLTGRLAGFRIQPEEWRPLTVLGLMFAAQVASMNVGTNLTSAAHSAILLNLYSVHTVVLAHFMIPGDRLTVRRLVGVLIADAGIVLLFARQADPGGATLLGDALIFVSALLLAERTIYMARAVHHFDPVKLLLSQAMIGILIFLLGSLALEPVATRWTARLGGSIAFQGVVVAGFNFMVNLWLLKRYRPSTLAAFFLTQPIFGVLIATRVAGDPLTADLVLASLAVAVGIGLSSR